MTLHGRQAARLEEILPWARLAGALRGIYRPGEQLVHLRPSGRGIRLVDLHPDRPQLDRGLIARHDGAAEKLHELLAVTQVGSPGRATPEKRLQSWLLTEAYRANGTVASLAPDLLLVTDEQRLPVADEGDCVCDLLGVRGTAPVVIELKSARQMTRLIEQLRVVASVVDAHRPRFADLFGAVLGRAVTLDRPCERWLVWPAAPGHVVDPRGDELARQGIQVVSYTAADDGYGFTIGPQAGARRGAE
jgi:hypothetical protein